MSRPRTERDQLPKAQVLTKLGESKVEHAQPTKGARKRFAVAFSLAGEQQALVDPIAAELDQRGYTVFYYAWRQFVAELAKPNLDRALREIYGAQTVLLIPVLSAAYASKPWTGVVELTVVRELIFDRRDDEVMTLRADDALVEGFSKLNGYVDIRGRTASDVADLIEMRLRTAGIIPHVSGRETHEATGSISDE